MRNKVARRLRELANWEVSDGKWLSDIEANKASKTGERHYTKTPEYAAYQLLKSKYKTLGTPLYSQDKGPAKD